ncbi:MAG TPA: aminoglycoside phosphotransferase, partial [Gammaproteobacteria bacterium]|nr:aminoglycoside phosphotransferase [Gammaproteobacteria bacterium]
IDRLQQVERWVGKQRAALENMLQRRKREGFIRECHGDLHLGNITLIDGRVTPFDCIEFNPGLRWIDVFSEVAFLLMDLDDRGYPSFDFRFLNGYLQHSGDYGGLGVLSWYKVYRALVRAKVAMLRRAQETPESAAWREAGEEYHQYMVLAESYIRPPRPRLLITLGLSGSGKSTLARRLCERAGMIQLRSDVERKRLAGMAATERSGSGIASGLYSRERTAQTYERLAGLARQVVQAGYPVIVDASFLQRSWRERFHGLAGELGVPFTILDCEAPVEVLEQRIRERARAGRDPSEATLEVLHHQLETRQTVTGDEQPFVIRVDTQQPGATERVLELLS